MNFTTLKGSFTQPRPKAWVRAHAYKRVFEPCKGVWQSRGWTAPAGGWSRGGCYSGLRPGDRNPAHV